MHAELIFLINHFTKTDLAETLRALLGSAPPKAHSDLNKGHVL